MYESRILKPETEIMKERQWLRIRGQNSVNKELWEIVGQCSEGDNCSFRHDINKRAKTTQSNSSPNVFMQQNEGNASRTRSPRGRSPSGRMSRWPCKDYLKGTCTNSFCEKWHPPECLFCKSESGCRFGEKCSYAHRQVEEQPSKRSKKNCDISAVAMCKRNEQHQRTGRPVLDAYSSSTRQLGCVFQDMEPPKCSSILRKSSEHTEANPMCKIHKSPSCVTLTSETKIHRLEWFAQEIFIRVTPMLQNLRIGLRKRRNGKSDVPAKQRGGWPKIS